MLLLKLALLSAKFPTDEKSDREISLQSSLINKFIATIKISNLPKTLAISLKQTKNHLYY
jgi:hypothetical protein